ncbi:putative quercetin-3-sulfate 4'-sulfotransferase [Helianthus annuus]|nr:putative quercetin-3-sulfate 4'-sulfotransferase [Helianthus annuus]KAJ0558033.1 putative quercetin-3-sulfate 4'-sulfotransferase [Helianthus annuus]KAJ0729392.1 putative quercetin-3-sulfate 4'-sulfotransferase [Helianthus annuus]KAJ0732122.1 putative quercetin-3-sulfate 4'-sulfotransferase [Helianthus annuus]
MSSSMEEVFETLPQHTCSWLKGKMTMHKYQDFWASKESLEGGILAQQNFKAEPSDVFLCSAHKTRTTWLKSLAFATATREKFDVSASPLLTKLVHECVPCLEKQFEEIKSNRGNSSLPFRILILKYDDLRKEPTSNVKRLAEFIGYPFSVNEEKAGVVDDIIKLCSFENLTSEQLRSE